MVNHWNNEGKTMPETTHDWEWFIPPIKMVMTGDGLWNCLPTLYSWIHG